MPSLKLGRLLLFAFILAALLLGALSKTSFAQRGELELTVIDSETGEPVAATVTIKTSKDRPYFPKNATKAGPAFCIGGMTMLNVSRGSYAFEITRGLEYRSVVGRFDIERGATDSKAVTLKRIRNLTTEGWYSGDLMLIADPENAPLIMNAADLQFANIISWSNSTNHWQDHLLPETPIVKLESGRIYDALGGIDWRKSGGLVFSNWPAAIQLQNNEESYQSPLDTMRFVKSNKDTFVAAIDASSWDLPLWLAGEQLDAVGVAAAALTADGVIQPLGSRPEVKGSADQLAATFWSERIYFHLLNAGFRIPPTAGSCSGQIENIPGYNRVFVHCGEEFSQASWLENHRLGRVVISNGPLLRVTANGGYLPGYVFRAANGGTVKVDLAADLALSEKATYLEIIHNGVAEHQIRLEEWAKKGGQLPTLEFRESGWFLVRVVTNNSKTVHFASTGPYYVEIGEKKRISKQSAQFFMDWVLERARALKSEKSQAAQAAFEQYRDAREFWNRILESANVD